MLSKIIVPILLIFGIWLTSHTCEAQAKKSANYTSISADGGNCRLYVKDIIFTKVPVDKTAKPVVAHVGGEYLINFNDSGIMDPQCGNNTENGIIELVYEDVEYLDGTAALSNFSLTWEIIYEKKFRWWRVSSLSLTAKGPMTDDAEVSGNWTGVLMKSMEIGASEKFSYACSKPSKLYFTSKNAPGPIYSLQFKDLHIQPFLTKAPKRIKANAFSGFTDNVDDCVPFFSAEVWMFLLTLLIFVGVILSGVVMLANMSTVNRFDDPKSKQMTIVEKN